MSAHWRDLAVRRLLLVTIRWQRLQSNGSPGFAISASSSRAGRRRSQPADDCMRLPFEGRPQGSPGACVAWKRLLKDSPWGNCCGSHGISLGEDCPDGLAMQLVITETFKGAFQLIYPRA